MKNLETAFKDIKFTVNHLLEDINNLSASIILNKAILSMLDKDNDLWHDITNPIWMDTTFCISLLESDWWYHWSHLEVAISPTYSDNDYWSNPLYSIDGAKIAFSQSLLNFSKTPLEYKLNLGILGAYSKYKLALIKIERARNLQYGYYLHIDTGNGPILVDNTGTFHKIPHGMMLGIDGLLTPKKHINDASVILEKYIPDNYS